MVREGGAKEVHVRISSPPTLFPCYYGIDTPNRSELIASSQTVEQTREFITADTLEYLSLEKMMEVYGQDKGNFCKACFDGHYPVGFDGKGVEAIQLNLFAVNREDDSESF